MSQSDFVTRGQALVASGQFQEAVKVCRLGLLGRPTTVEGRIVLGQALLALKRYDEVLAEMRVALELDHSSLSAQILKADALLKKGDLHAAGEVLAKLRPFAGSDPRIGLLAAEVERGGARPSMSASHPAVGFLGPGSGESLTKHYPNHGADDEITGNDDEPDHDHFTKPTSIAAPGSKKRSGKQQAMDDGTPPPAVLAVGDRSGTVEVDPEAEAIEVGDDDDFGEIAAPPVVGSASRQRAAVVLPPDESRGSVRRATKSPKPEQAKARAKPRPDVSSVELDSDDMIELDDPPRRPSGPGTAVRNAVKMPAGPLGAPSAPLPSPFPAPTPASVRPTAIAQAVQPPLAQQLAQQPHYMQALPPTPAPLPPQPQRPDPRILMAASMPTAAAMEAPRIPPGASPTAVANAARPTMALNAAQQQSAAAVDALFGADQQPQAWAKNAGTAAANEPTSKPGALDPRIAIASPVPAGTLPPNLMFPETSTASGKPLKTGVRRGRSRLAVAMWILIGAVVIGGGVFAGFQIRAMRLKKQIAAARDQAVDLAKADTWLGWSGARDRLAGIAQASGTIDNRAALARARAVLAFEFGDGLAEAKAAVDKLVGQSGLDLSIARAYVALAQNDAAAAKTAADKAVELAPNDAAALSVTGEAALLAGDYKNAISSLRSAYEHEPRPLYAVGLAHAIAETGGWDDALTAVERALGLMPENPGALIQRAFLLAGSGKIVPGTVTTEVRATLVKLTVEGAKPLAEQPRGVSPVQVALANLALAQLDFALHDTPAALNDVRAALAVNADEQRFGEEAIDTLYLLGELQRAKAGTVTALTLWPGSRRARISQALITVALGRPAEAIDILTRSPDAVALPRGLAVRGYAKFQLGDLDAAKADYDAALKKLPKLELALVGRAWIDLATGDVDEARKRIEPLFNPNSPDIALGTVYAAILRASNEPGQRDRARGILEKLATGPATPDVARAQLELGRVARDAGDMKAARAAFADATRSGSAEARLDNGLLLIEDTDPQGGRDTIDGILKDAGATPSAQLLLEGARAHMLSGDNQGASALLDQADKIANVTRWQYDRERGRLALRRNDIAGASQALFRALDASGPDAETFELAADTVSSDPKGQAPLLVKVKSLASARLKDQPEGLIITGKLALAADQSAEADKAYQAALKAFEKTTPRRAAQAHFGAAAVFVNKSDYPSAQIQLAVVLQSDPSLYTAYLFAAEVELQISGPSANQRAFVLAQKAVAANPDFVQGWVQLGTYAHNLGKKKELEDAITHVGALAPSSDSLKELQALRK